MSHPLNPAQREAVRHCDGPLLVLAGAGSGKTRVITAKIAHLIERGVAPARIVAITFTNKAAHEMRERAQTLLKVQGLGELATKVTIATFHALGLKIVRSEAGAMGLKAGFSVFDPADLESIVGELVATADRGRVRAAQWKISAWKNALVSPAEALRLAQNDWCRGRKRAGAQLTGMPSRFIGELAQQDLRYADMPLPPDAAANEKAAGSERLKSLKAMLVR